MKNGILKRLLGLPVALLLGVGCASSGIELPAVGAAPIGESIVFGMVEVAGELLADMAILASGSNEITVWSLDRDEEIAVLEIEPDSQNAFYWHFPPGEYAIMHYREDRTVSLIIASQTKSDEITLEAEFTVPAEPSNVYLGTLRVNLTEKEKRVTKAVRDDLELALPAFRERHPQARGEVVKSLMRFRR